MKSHDYPGMRANLGLLLALDPVTIIAVAATVTAATAVTEGTMNYLASQKAANAEKSLKDQQAAELQAQSAAAAQQAARQAVTGQTFGGERITDVASTGLGFGTASKSNGGRAALTGMG